MDSNNYQDWQAQNEPGQPNPHMQQVPPGRFMPDGSSKGFATASLVLGVIAIISAFTMTVLPPVIFGSLAIILGLLSRGSQRHLSGHALGGVATAAGALVLNLLICIFSFVMVFSNPDTTKEYLNMLNQTYEEMLGISLEDLMEEYGLDAGSLFE